MTTGRIAQLLLSEFDEEMAATRRVLERVPSNQYAWKPHPRSMSLRRLAMHVAELPKWALDAFAVDEVDIAPHPGPPTNRRVGDSVTNIVQWFTGHAQAARAAVAAATDDEFAQAWTLKSGGRTLWTKSRLAVYRNAINHMIHHRGQLTLYLRLNGVPVPGVYGPSADEQELSG